MLYPPVALKSSSKSLGRTAKAMEAQEALKKKQARALHTQVPEEQQQPLMSRVIPSGGLEAAAGHEEEEAGDAEDSNRLSEGKKPPFNPPIPHLPPIPHRLLSAPSRL